MTLPAFEVYLPVDLPDALTFLAENQGNTKIIAGGTDIVPSLKQRLFEPSYLLDLKPLRELYGIHETPDGGLRIGALTTIHTLATSSLLANQFPVLQRAASTVAGPGLRNVGTLGGNICLDTRCYWYNQSFFWRKSCNFCIKKDGTMCHVAPGSKKCWAVYSGDTAAALIALDAKIRLRSKSGERILSLPDFFVNDGQIRNRVEPGEILTDVLIPGSVRGYEGTYEKFRVRGSVDYPLAGVAIVLKRSNGNAEDIRVALTAVNPLPLRLDGISAISVGDSEAISNIQRIANRAAKPLKTSASTMDYRRHMVGVMVKRGFEKLLSGRSA